MSKVNVLSMLLKEVPNKQYLYFTIATISKALSIVILPFYIERVTESAINNDYGLAIFLTTLYFVLVTICEIAYTQISKRNYTIYNELRRRFSIRIQEKILSMEYDKFESSEELEKVYAALEVTGSNDTGIEGIYHTLFDIGWRICSLLIFAVYFLHSIVL